MGLLATMFKQKNAWSCGPAVMRLVLHWYFSRPKTVRELVRELKISPAGTSDSQMVSALRRHRIPFKIKKRAVLGDVKKYLPTHLVVIAYWIPAHKEAHYSIIRRLDKERIYLHDTWFGSRHSYSLPYFTRQCWREREYRWLLLISK